MKRHLTQLEKQTLLNEFEKHLNEVTDGKVSFTKTITLPEKIKIYYTPDAFSKTVRLIMSHTMEVAWHCLVRKKDTNYEVYDVLSYPQTVGPAHVHVKMGRTFGDGNHKDPTKYYTDWYNEVVLNMPEEEEANLCGQCHSHVNMGTTPSSVDMAQQKEELELKGGTGYYLFQIWNKKLEVNSFLYDLDAGVIYEKEDIEVVVEDDDFTEMSHKMLFQQEPEKPKLSEKKKEAPKKVVDYTKETDYDRYSRFDRYGDSYYDYSYVWRNLHNYSVGAEADNVSVNLVIEAHSVAEAEYLFQEWADENLDYLSTILEEAGAKNTEEISFSKAVWVPDSEIVDVPYDELIGVGSI